MHHAVGDATGDSLERTLYGRGGGRKTPKLSLPYQNQSTHESPKSLLPDGLLSTITIRDSSYAWSRLADRAKEGDPGLQVDHLGCAWYLRALSRGRSVRRLLGEAFLQVSQLGVHSPNTLNKGAHVHFKLLDQLRQGHEAVLELQDSG